VSHFPDSQVSPESSGNANHHTTVILSEAKDLAFAARQVFAALV
jgi:hypothetical protein